MDIYKRMKDLREDHDYKQSYVASVLKCARYTYQRYEYRKLTPTAEKICLLAKLYNCSTDYILGISNEPGSY